MLNAYRLISRGAFLFSQAVLPMLLKSEDLEHPPTLLFTGATAAMKGSAKCASFASGKFAMRALIQSLAREFGPMGVHVSHIIIDGVIDIERTKAYQVSDAPDSKISPQAVSLDVHCSRSSAYARHSDCGLVLVPPYATTIMLHQRA